MTTDSKVITKVFTRAVQQYTTDIFLSGDITAPENYIEELQVLNEAQEGDQIKLHINSGGGWVSTAQQYVNAIRNTKASVTASLEGECHSAATYIFLACGRWEVNSGVLMLIHNYSAGAYGKGGDLIDNVQANDRWVKNIMADIYEGFLTPEEIDLVNKNQDIWMETEEILKRLEGVISLREKKIALVEAEEQQKALLTVQEHINASENSSRVQESTKE